MVTSRNIDVVYNQFEMFLMHSSVNHTRKWVGESAYKVEYFNKNMHKKLYPYVLFVLSYCAKVHRVVSVSIILRGF